MAILRQYGYKKDLITRCEEKSNKNIEAFTECWTKPKEDVYGKCDPLRPPQALALERCLKPVTDKMINSNKKCEAQRPSADKITFQDEVKFARCTGETTVTYVHEKDNCMGKASDALKQCHEKALNEVIALCEKEADSKNIEVFTKCNTNSMLKVYSKCEAPAPAPAQKTI